MCGCHPRWSGDKTADLWLLRGGVGYVCVCVRERKAVWVVGGRGWLVFKTLRLPSTHPTHPFPLREHHDTSSADVGSIRRDAAIKASIGVSFSHSPNDAISWLKAWLLLSEGEGRVVRGRGEDLSWHHLQHTKLVASVPSQSICCTARHREFKYRYTPSTASLQTTTDLPACSLTAGFALGNASCNYEVCIMTAEN